MRIKWRGLELPSDVMIDESVNTGFYGKFIIEPFEQGFGTTIGNSLRRVLLSSLEGAAVTHAKITGVSHEFSTIEGVLEDVTDILLNIKGIVLSLDGTESATIRVKRDFAGEVCAGDFELRHGIRILNPGHKIATLTSDVTFETELHVRKGRGYVAASENRNSEMELGVIPVDSVYSPVRRVRYRTEDMRVGQRTNYDRLILEVWTDGTIRPEDALVEAGLILRKHLNPIVMYQELGHRQVGRIRTTVESPVSHSSPQQNEFLSRSITALNLSVRAANCLEAARISTIGELLALSEADLLRFRSFGKTSLHEVQRKLTDMGLSLAPGPSSGSAASMGSQSSETSGSLGIHPIPSRSTGDTGDFGHEGNKEESDHGGSGPLEVFTMPDDS